MEAEARRDDVVGEKTGHMADKNYYEVLDLEPSASAEEIQDAYRLLTSIYHPDRFPPGTRQWLVGHEKMQEINAAYSVLRDENKRQTYNTVVLGLGEPIPTMVVPPPEEAGRSHLASDFHQYEPAPNPPGTPCGLESAITEVHDGDTILLGAGTYHLNASLCVRHSITIRGQGPDHSRLVCNGMVVRYAEGGEWELAGLTLENSSYVGNVVEVSDGKLTVRQCRLTKGDHADVGNHSGLCVGGKSKTTVESCEFVRNSNGIVVQDSAFATVMLSTCHHNMSCGIVFSGKSRGSVKRTRCEFNRAHGILVAGQAHAELEENWFNYNKTCGIVFSDSSTGTAIKNDCDHNSRYALNIADTARPRLADNSAPAHQQARQRIRPF